MSNNLIQIKRSNTSATPGTVLYDGELGFSYDSNNLFIGAQSGVGAAATLIGGYKYAYVNNAGSPGTQTANAVVILDGNSFVTNTFTQGLVIQTSSGSITSPVVTSISNTANSTVLGGNTLGGGMNSELVTSDALITYIGAVTGAAVGANGQFLFNNSGITTGAYNFNYDYNDGTITVGNNTVNVQLGYVSGAGQQLQHWHGDSNSYVQVQLTNHNTGSSASTDYILNADNYTDSTNYVDIGINGSGWSNSQWTINGPDDGYLYAANGNMAIGTASNKAVQFFANGTLDTNEVMRITAGANVGIGNTNPNAKLQVTGTANISGNVAIGGITTFGANIVLGSSSISANGATGTVGQILYSDGTKNYWGAPSSAVTGSNTQVQFNDSGIAGASANLTFDKVSAELKVGNSISVPYLTATNGSRILVTNYGSVSNKLGIAGDVAIGTSTGGNVYAPSTATINIGTTTINSTVYTGTSNNASYLGTVAASSYATKTYADNAADTAFSNASSYAVTMAATAYSNATSYADTKAATAYSNATSYADTKAGTAYSNAMSDTLSRNGSYTGNNTFSGANLVVSGTNTSISSNVTFTGANVDMASSLLRTRDAIISGNLTVSGTLSSIDTNNIQVKDGIIKLSDQQATTGTFLDTLDTGFYSEFGNTGSKFYAGIYRDHAGSSNTNPLFKIFASNTEPTSIVDNTALAYTIGTLQAYLTPYGVGGAFIANASTITVTANATVNVNITANSMTLSTALNAASGGTGQNSYTVGDLLYASGTTTLSKLSVPGSVANGQVLQITNNLPAYGTLDGGTF